MVAGFLCGRYWRKLSASIPLIAPIVNNVTLDFRRA
jgi:hypothetical protein